MKQRIVVQIVLKDKDGNILILRRATGSQQHIGQYELPGGTAQDGEQPDDAIRRHLLNDTGLTLSAFVLKDALNLTDRENSDLEQLFIVYEAGVTEIKPTVTPRGSYDAYDWASSETLKTVNLRDSASIILNLTPRSSDILSSTTASEARPSATRFVLYSDGGSRGNPGPSSAAFVIVDTQANQTIEADGVYLGITTNNQAEYHGLRLGIERAIEKGILNLECRMDSMLVVNQLNGSYHIKNRELWPIFERIRSYLPQFERITFVYIPREENTKADAMVNKLLDQHQNDTM